MSGPYLSFDLPQSGPVRFLPPNEHRAANVAFATPTYQVEILPEPTRALPDPQPFTARYRISAGAWFGADNEPMDLSDPLLKRQLSDESLRLEQVLNTWLVGAYRAHMGPAPRLDPIAGLHQDNPAPQREAYDTLRDWRRAHSVWLATIAPADAAPAPQPSDQDILHGRISGLLARVNRPAEMRLGLGFDLDSNTVNLLLRVPPSLAQSGLAYRAIDAELHVDPDSDYRTAPRATLQQIACSQIIAICRAVQAAMAYYAPQINAQVEVQTSAEPADLLSLHIAPQAWGLDIPLLAKRSAAQWLGLATTHVQCRPDPGFSLSALR